MSEHQQIATTLPAHVCKHLIDGKPFPLPDGSPGSERYLHELPMLPHLKAEIDRRCREPGGRSRIARQNAIYDALKFYYLLGKHAVCRWTPKGELIIRVFDIDEDNHVVGDYIGSPADRNGIGVLSVPEYDGIEITLV